MDINRQWVYIKSDDFFLQRGSDTTVVPLHDPLKKGTLRRILNQAEVSVEELVKAM